MATFTKEVIKEGSGPGIQVGQNVTVEANLYLAADNTAIWSVPCSNRQRAPAADTQAPVGLRRSTHQPSGFLFPSSPPQPFTYSSGTGGVIKGCASPRRTASPPPQPSR